MKYYHHIFLIRPIILSNLFYYSPGKLYFCKKHSIMVPLELFDDPVYNQWMESDEHICNYTKDQVKEIIHSDSFKEWLKENPRGTIDLYYLYLHNNANDSINYLINYAWAKQEQSKYLNSKLDNCEEKIYTLHKELDDTKDELSNMENIAIGSSISLVILLLLYIYMVLKSRKMPYSIHFQNPIKIRKNKSVELPQKVEEIHVAIEESPKSKVFLFIKIFFKILIYIVLIWALLIVMYLVPSSRIPITVVLVCLFINWNKLFKKKKE